MDQANNNPYPSPSPQQESSLSVLQKLSQRRYTSSLNNAKQLRQSQSLQSSCDLTTTPYKQIESTPHQVHKLRKLLSPTPDITKHSLQNLPLMGSNYTIRPKKQLDGLKHIKNRSYDTIPSRPLNESRQKAIVSQRSSETIDTQPTYLPEVFSIANPTKVCLKPHFKHHLIPLLDSQTK